MRRLLDTVDRLPLGSFVEVPDGCLIVTAVTADPCPGRPCRLRIEGLDADSRLPEPPMWLEPGEIVHYHAA